MKEYFDNPFYHNYIFTDADAGRVKIKRWEYPFLFVLPTYVQITNNFVFHFKTLNGRIYLMKIADRRDRAMKEVHKRNYG